MCIRDRYLVDSLGADMAKQYLNANQCAVYNIRDIVKNENIDCDFEKQDSFVYTTDPNEVEKIKLENDVVNELGFKSEFTTKLKLPFPVLGAIKFPNQAQFNPVKYGLVLANKILERGGEIFTNSLVDNVEQKDNILLVSTKNNYIKSKYVILASHYPFIDRLGYYFLKMYQSCLLYTS